MRRGNCICSMGTCCRILPSLDPIPVALVHELQFIRISNIFRYLHASLPSTCKQILSLQILKACTEHMFSCISVNRLNTHVWRTFPSAHSKAASECVSFVSLNLLPMTSFAVYLPFSSILPLEKSGSQCSCPRREYSPRCTASYRQLSRLCADRNTDRDLSNSL